MIEQCHDELGGVNHVVNNAGILRDRMFHRMSDEEWDAVIDTSGYVPRVVGDSATLLADSCNQYVFISTISVYARYDEVGIDEDFELATISATKLQDYEIRMTVTVRQREGDRLAVRANARFNEKPIEDPKSYQDFFTALDKAMFLTLHKVD